MTNLRQACDTLLMVRPANFGFNEETAVTNTFQAVPTIASSELQQAAIKEFDNYVDILRSKGIRVVVIQDTESPIKPDAIFPNNWVSFHEDGSATLFPMCTPNRRCERRMDIFDTLKDEGFRVTDIHTIEPTTSEDFLEGTGSIIIDRVHKHAYACLSPRTDKKLLDNFCALYNYTPITFTSTNRHGIPIYHTNVMMCIASKYAVICLDSIVDLTERAIVVDTLQSTGHEIIDLSFDQIDQFAGNMLSIQPRDSEQEYIVMSTSAYNALTQGQIEKMKQSTELLPIDINFIETVGGGSARCMIAEVFLPRQ